MGSPPDEPCRDWNDAPLHRVELTHGFRIQRYETTNAEYYTTVGKTRFPSSHTPTTPARHKWYRAAAYCNELSRQENLELCYTCEYGAEKWWVNKCRDADKYSGQKIYDCPGYRLPTEAEWEYAYRAGTSTALYNGPLSSCKGEDPNADLIACYSESVNCSSCPQDIGQKMPNAWGLHDMAGNATEFAHDLFGEIKPDAAVDPWGNAKGYTTGHRVVKGGSCGCFAERLRGAWRAAKDPDIAASVGFRCVRTEPSAK